MKYLTVGDNIIHRDGKQSVSMDGTFTASTDYFFFLNLTKC